MSAFARRTWWLVQMAWRDSRTHRGRLLLSVAAVAVGIAALVGMRSLADVMSASIDAQANELLGADLVVSSSQAFSEEARALFAGIDGEQSRQVRFSSVVFFPKNGALRLAQVRSLDGGFPYYGAFGTYPPEAGRNFVQGRNALVDETLMLQFDAQVDDSVKVGALTFRIAGRLQQLPGETAAASNLEPRLYIPHEYLARTLLIQQGSRVSYRRFFNLPQTTPIEPLMKRLQPRLEEMRLNYETVASRKRNLGRPLTNLYRFLNLGSFIALILGSVGVASSIHTYVKQKWNTIAVLRSMGATAGQTIGIYLLQSGAMGLIGTLAGIAGGLGVVLLLPLIVGDLLPIDLAFSLDRLTAAPLVQGLYIGLGMALLFALLPLAGIRQVSPLLALRASFEERPARRDPLTWFIYLLIAVVVCSFALSQTRSWTQGLGFTAALGLAFVLLTLVAAGVTRGVRAFFPSSWSYIWRQGLANLYRPHNQTSMLMLALGLGTFLIATLYLTQKSLLDFIFSISRAERTNMVLIDIQTDQLEALRDTLATSPVQLEQQVPIVAMRLDQIDGRNVEDIRRGGGRRGGWALDREYRSTYRSELADTETLVAGQWRGATATDTVYISLEEGLARRLQVHLGTELVFDVQGVPITTVVGSLRQVDWQRVRTNFFVVFPPGVLEEAPQFHVFLLHSPSTEACATLQRRLINPFPNVSTIDLKLILSTVNTILDKASLVIRFMAMFSVGTGLLVLIGVVTGSRYQRLRESVLLKTLGASRRQVLQITLLEYCFLGGLAALSGVLLALGGTWALAHFVFDIPFEPAWTPVGVVLLLVAGLTTGVGMLFSRGIHNRPPLEVLRGVG